MSHPPIGTVIATCRRCGAEKTQEGPTYVRMFHNPGCPGGQGDWHHEARAAIDEAGSRDLRQIEERVREYGGNVEKPAGYVGPKRHPDGYRGPR